MTRCIRSPIRARAGLFVTLTCSLVLACGSTWAASPALSPAKARRIDAIFAAYAHDTTPGYAVGVVKDGALIYARGYGMADLDNRVPITPKTSFHLASLSKQFTAAAVALLILDGKLSLETPLAEYFPQIRKFGADLRLKHLMYFTSGLPEYTSRPRANGLPWFSLHYFTTDEAIAASLGADTLEFEPGTDWAYSNVNFMLLAKMVARASGQPFGRFVEERIFAPLHMTGSQVNDDSTLVVPHRATGYADRGNPEVVAFMKSVGIHVREGKGYVRLVRNSPHYGGSGVFSTIEDLARWDANFDSGALAGPAFTQLMYKRVRFAHDKDNDAFGLVFGQYAGRQMIWFAGEDLDASTYMARFPEERLAVYVLSNMPLGKAQDKATEVIDVLLDRAGEGAPGDDADRGG